MLASMRPSELGRWLAFYRLDPWGAQRDDLRAGYIAATLAPAWLKKASGAAFQASDFLPQFDVPAAEDIDHKTLSRQLRAALGGIPTKDK